MRSAWRTIPTPANAASAPVRWRAPPRWRVTRARSFRRWTGAACPGVERLPPARPGPPGSTREAPPAAASPRSPAGVRSAAWPRRARDREPRSPPAATPAAAPGAARRSPLRAAAAASPRARPGAELPPGRPDAWPAKPAASRVRPPGPAQRDFACVAGGPPAARVEAAAANQRASRRAAPVVARFPRRRPSPPRRSLRSIGAARLPARAPPDSNSPGRLQALPGGTVPCSAPAPLAGVSAAPPDPEVLPWSRQPSARGGRPAASGAFPGAPA